MRCKTFGIFLEEIDNGLIYLNSLKNIFSVLFDFYD